jgi:V/A-type H+-transporting ATPase subunit E
MDGIEKITARIAEDVQAEISAIEAESARQTLELQQKYQEMAMREHDAVLGHGRVRAAEREQRLAGMAALEAKKQVLSAKQQLLSQVFELAEQRLCQMPAGEYVSFLASLVTSAAKSGQEQIILSPKDKEQYGAAVVTEVNKRWKNGKFSLAENCRDIKGGFLLSQGDVEINCTFESLIDQLRGELTLQVAQILFGAE